MAEAYHFASTENTREEKSAKTISAAQTSFTFYFQCLTFNVPKYLIAK